MSDGREQIIASDGSWKWTSGPVTFSHIYAGEDYDARSSPAGWKSAGFDDRAWKPVLTVAPPAASLTPYTGPPMQAFDVFRPSKVVSPRAGEYTYVFPQNSSALLRFTVTGTPGQKMRFKPCEYMDSTGQVKFTYTWGTGKDIWHDCTIGSAKAESHQQQHKKQKDLYMILISCMARLIFQRV